MKNRYFVVVAGTGFLLTSLAAHAFNGQKLRRDPTVMRTVGVTGDHSSTEFRTLVKNLVATAIRVYTGMGAGCSFGGSHRSIYGLQSRIKGPRFGIARLHGHRAARVVVVYQAGACDTAKKEMNERNFETGLPRLRQ